MPHAPDLSGRALDDRYELHAVIGEGAFGRVYSGWDRRLERTVAVKIIKPWWAEDPDWAPNFEREARLLARISHPGIVLIFDVGKADEGLYYVSELVDGESLAQRLKEVRPTPWEAAALTEQLCRALAQAHAARVIHRDVKPANILISSEGRVKVGDFGVARLAEGSTDGASATIVGTPRYMAPEQARGRGATPATDVYSVGIVLYELLAGRPPFTEHVAVELALRHLNDTPIRCPAGLRPGSSRSWPARWPRTRPTDTPMARRWPTPWPRPWRRRPPRRARPRFASARDPVAPARAGALAGHHRRRRAEPGAPRRNRGEGPPRRRASGPPPGHRRPGSHRPAGRPSSAPGATSTRRRGGAASPPSPSPSPSWAR